MKKNPCFLLSLLCFVFSFNLLFGGPLAVTLTKTNVSCFGGRNGAVNITVSGGTSPYTYLWSTAATTQNISGVAAGYYQVTVTDAVSATVSGNVTLTEPTQLTLHLTPSIYSPQNTNISCYTCCNGYINISVSGGVTSYSYSWSTGQTTANISNLCKNNYAVTVTDANGCTITDQQPMGEPDKDTWAQSGNSGSNPSTQFVGNTDSVDLSFRTNNSERFRIKANGDIKASKLTGTGYQLVMTDSVGIIKRLNGSTAPGLMPWTMAGNSGTSPSTQFIGTIDSVDFVFKTKNTERLRINANGDIKFPLLAGNGNSGLYVDNNGVLKGIIIPNCGGINVIPSWSNDASNLFPNCDWVNVGIGTQAPSQKLEVSHNSANGGMVLNRKTNGGTSPSWKSEIKFAYNGDEKWAIGNDLNGNGHQTFFIWDNVGNSTRFMINQYGKIGIGVDPPATNATAYLLYVAGGIMTRDVKVTANPFADYVFNTDYKLMGIYELEQFIKQNHHLPEIPSANDIEKNEGFEVGDMQVKLLKKIEEQSLYIIEQQKQIDELKARMKNLERRK